jgi:hypothetical protein
MQKADILGKTRTEPAAATLARMQHRSSPHEGSKTRHTQLTDVAQDRPSRIAAALTWSQATGRPVPPHMRFRRVLQPASPLSIASRSLSTPAQIRRARHKHGRRELAAVIGYDPGEREAERVAKIRAVREIRRVTREAARHLPLVMISDESALIRHALAGQAVLSPDAAFKITGVS